MDKICEYCGTLMKDVRSDKKYCSRSCQGKAQREKKKQGIDTSHRICQKCGKEFVIKPFAYNRSYCYDCVPDGDTPKTGSEMRAIIKKWVVDEKDGACIICGYNKCLDALEFHHLNPNEKEFNISDRQLKYSDWPLIKTEIEKGVLVCSNCHKEIHAGMHPEYLKGE